jgi:hypothetical protein
MARFARVLTAVPAVTKNQTAHVGAYDYSYVDINSILGMLKPLLTTQGLALSQPIKVEDGQMVVTTLIIDVLTGENVTFPGPGFPIKGDPQAAGSAITYYRRYAIVSLFGLQATDDDDGGQAHRADATPNDRTTAETSIRALITGVTDADQRHEMVRRFRERFGCGLVDLPESRHGEALHWAIAYMNVDTLPSPETNESDPT